MPYQSTEVCGRVAAASSRGKRTRHSQTARIPSGRLMKKIHRQPRLSVSHPPRTGPIAGPAMTPRPKSAWAIGRSSRGKASKTSDCALASKPPPVMPWITRAKISMPRLWEKPQASEARVKPTSEKRK